MRNLKIAVLAGAALLLSALPASSDAGSPGAWMHKSFTQWHPHAGHRELGSTGTQCYFCKPNKDGDDDRDGVPNSGDQCPHTPQGAAVDHRGCSLDSDGDGVVDSLDQCPGTPRGTDVDTRGCPLDRDGDGVLDSSDRCPDTPRGASVNRDGCWIIKDLHFRVNDATILSSATRTLQHVGSILKQNSNLRVEIQGHTDSTGNDRYNKSLSDRRAKAVRNYLVRHGVSSKRLSSHGYGEERPIASNDTAAGRAENRRVQLSINR